MYRVVATIPVHSIPLNTVNSHFTARTTLTTTTTSTTKRTKTTVGKRKTRIATATQRLTATFAAMSTATCTRFCGPLTGANKTSASSKVGGSSSKLTAGNGSNMTSSALPHKKQIATNDNNTEATFTFKLGRATADSHVSASSESSDPLESDYSEETEEEEQPHQTKKTSTTTQSKHVSVSSRSSSSATTTSADNDGDEVDDEDDANEDGGHDTDDVVTNNDDSEESEQDDGNETDDEETDEESEESSSVQTAKGVRKYHLDDYQIIKTVGEYELPSAVKRFLYKPECLNC